MAMPSPMSSSAVPNCLVQSWVKLTSKMLELWPAPSTSQHGKLAVPVFELRMACNANTIVALVTPASSAGNGNE